MKRQKLNYEYEHGEFYIHVTDAIWDGEHFLEGELTVYPYASEYPIEVSKAYREQLWEDVEEMQREIDNAPPCHKDYPEFWEGRE